MRFGLLGPLEAGDGPLLPLGGPKQKAVLAMLLLEANRPVSRERLVEGLWGDRAPPSANETLDSYLYRLRRLLGPERLSRQPAGYVLRVEKGELDLARFDELVSASEELLPADPAAARGQLREALALWRGDALADVRYEPFASGVADRLDERRLSALERRAEADLAAGLGPELVSELEQLVRDHPGRERSVAHLMRALYRAGRPTDALAAMQACRRHLAHDHGVSPGPELCELERQVLDHDPALAFPPHPVPIPSPGPVPPPLSGPPTPGPEQERRRPRLRSTWKVATTALVGVALVATLLSVARPGASLSVVSDANMLLPINGRTDVPGNQTVLPAQPGAVAAAGGSVWVASPSGGVVLQVDQAKSMVVDRIPVSGEPGDLVSGGGALWVVTTTGATVERVDPSEGSVVGSARITEGGPVATAAIAYGGGGVWVAEAANQAVLELNPVSGAPVGRFSLDVRPTSLAFADGLLWVAAYDSGTVEGIDPMTGQTVGTVAVGDGPAAMAVSGPDLWVANSLDATVSVIDTATFTIVSTIPVGSGPTAIEATGNAVWVANEYSGSVSRISPRHLEVVATVYVGNSPEGLAWARGQLWVGAAAAAGRKGGTLVLASTQGFFGSIDPAFYNGAPPLTFLRLEYDSLVTFEPTAGPDGLRLVPDLSLEVPVPSDGGRTYSFLVRPNIHYSDGAPLKASDFRRGIERLFAIGSPGADYYSGLVGAGACAARPEHCNLSQGVITDDNTGSIVFHLTAPDPDFLYKLTVAAFGAPVPPGTPDREVGFKPLAGTGPYRVISATSKQVIFERNPYFREWSHAAQPSGNPDKIVWLTSSSNAEIVKDIQKGKVDWTWDSLPPAELQALQAEYPSQVHSNPGFFVEFIPFNTRIAPFNSLLAREALNYAIDRRKIVEMYGGPTVATPTCQPLIPGLLGYERYCPYTLGPGPSGTWSAPNLGLAKKLVDKSGTKGDEVTVWGSPDEGTIPPQEAAYVTQLLGKLGYKARLRMVPIASITASMWASFQISVDGDWGPDYPDPSSYIPQFFGCDGGDSNGYYCNPALDREMSEAAQLELQGPSQAGPAWAAVDHALTNQAVWVPTVNLNEVDFTSKRLRDYEFNPVWGFVADQAVVR